MKPFFTFSLLFVFTLANAQFEGAKNTKKGTGLEILAIGSKTPKKPTSITVAAEKGFKKAYKNKKKTKKEREQALKNKGIITQEKLSEERFLKSFKKINGKYQYPKIDQDLGTFRTQSKFITIKCRDSRQADGDRVTILINDILVISDITLKESYQTYKIFLEKGINKIEIIALNQGTAGQNTAYFQIHNDLGSLLSSNEWLLSTGAKATFMIVKSD